MSNIGSLTVITGNVRSLRNKFDELQNLITSTQPDVIALTESWLTLDIEDSEVKLNGYTLFRSDRSSCRSGGGVVLYCHSSLRPMLLKSTRDTNCTEEFLSCRIRHCQGQATIAVSYRAPDSEGHITLNELSRVAENQDCLILGDFNAPHINWFDISTRSGSTEFERNLIDMAITANLTQCVKEATRIQPGQEANILDLIFTHSEEEVTDLIYMDPLCSSDHVLLKFNWNRRKLTCVPTKPRRNVWKADLLSMKAEALGYFWGDDASMNLDQLCDIFTKNLHNLLERFAPLCKKQSPKQTPPWFDHELKSMLKTRKKLWDNFKATGCPDDYNIYKTCRNSCSTLKRQKRFTYERNLATTSSSAPKKLYAYLRRRTKTCNGIPPLQHPTGGLLEEDEEKAAILCSQYSSVFCMEDDNLTNIQARCDSVLNGFTVDPSTVEELLKSLDEQSSPGPDELHPRILKHLSSVISYPLALLFQKSLDCGKLPAGWKMAVVKPMFKGGRLEDPANYRPVSLTSVLCKVFEKMLKQKIDSHFRHLGLWSSEQHGFRQGRSCTSNLLLAREMWAKTLDAGGRADVIYVDFSKAFDRVPHRRLLSKLSAYGISGKILAWIKDFLVDRSMRVKVNETLSDSVPCFSGVPQGSVLGPILFNIYVNDLPQRISADCLLYADDLKLWLRVNDDTDVDNLQTALDCLDHWSKEWLLPINIAKCCVLPIGGIQPVGVYHIGGFLLRESSLERDLGMLVSSDFRMTDESRRKSIAASKLMWAIRRSFVCLTPEMFRILFISHVRPILEYGQPAFQPTTQGECIWLENVQRRGTKAIAGFYNISYEDRLKRLNLFSLEHRRHRGDLIYTWKILTGQMGREILGFFDVATDKNTRGHIFKLNKPRRLRIGLKLTLSTRVVNSWNSLPMEVVSATSETVLKKKLDEYLKITSGGTCFCCRFE